MLVSILLILSLTLGEDIVGGVDVKKPRILDFAGMARWLAHENFWGTIGTISVRLDGAPFTQPKSFVDGPADNSTGVLYFYDSIMDESLVDIIENNVVSFSLSATQLGHCPPTKISDPENPMCARVAFSGKFVAVDDREEEAFAKNAFFARHPLAPRWPHDMDMFKIDIDSIWLIDLYGGAKDVDVAEYYAYKY